MLVGGVALFVGSAVGTRLGVVWFTQRTALRSTRQ